MTEELNGLSIIKLKEIVGTVQEEPEKAEPMNKWTARVEWVKGFRSRAYVRNHVFDVDEPSDLAGVDTSPNAVEYVLAALGGCYIGGFILNATKRGVNVENLEVSLEGQLDNILTYFGLSDQGHSGYREVQAKLYVKSDADEKVLREIWKDTIATSPVSNTLQRSVSIRPEISVVR